MELVGKQPCLILMNHSSFTDMKLAFGIFYPRRMGIVTSVDAMTGVLGKLMRFLGCTPTHKYVSDISLIHDIKYMLKENKTLLPCCGYGYDVHAYGGNRPLMLGGVEIGGDFLVSAHSDGDVLLHALMDAILGCLAAGDIGHLFPDNDPKFDGISSVVLLDHVMNMAAEAGLRICHVDLTVIAQKPKLAPYIEQMRRNIATALGIRFEDVSVKATTEEGLGFTGSGEGIAAHCVWVSEEDMDITAKKHITAVHNPVSNLKLASGVARTSLLAQHGVNVALGTDGVASNNNHDLFEEIKLASLLQKGVNLDPVAVPASQALKMATVNGAKALRRNTGVIAEGKIADLILLNFEDLNLFPCHDVAENLVYSARGSNVCMNMARGKVIYENGVFHTLDVERIREEMTGYALPKIFG